VAPGQGVPTGVITFKRGSTVLGTAALNAQGVATFSIASLPVGSNTITASYATTTNYNSSTSSSVTTTVSKIKTTITLQSSKNPSAVGQSVRFTATVAAVAPGTGVPTGQVQFRVNGSNFGSPVTLVNGVAISAATSTLSAGNRSITAVYLGNTQTASSTSATLTQAVLSASNNNFSSRITLSGRNVSVTATNVGATFESGEPKHAGVTGGRSVWWTWTPTVSGLVTIDTAGSDFDTLLAVYTGNGVSSLVSVTSNNNASSGETTSKVTFNAVAGRAYRIAVDGNAGASGIIKLKLTQ
jgi:hypothetical protein